MIFLIVIENEADPSQLERVEQLQGLGIFAAAKKRSALSGKYAVHAIRALESNGVMIGRK